MCCAHHDMNQIMIGDGVSGSGNENLVIVKIMMICNYSNSMIQW